MQVEVLGDGEAFAHRVADWILGLALGQSGDFAVVLTGGSTPKPISQRPASSDYRSRFPWHHAHWFVSDERFVPHDDARSNFRMAWVAMLSRVPVPPGNIHAVRTEDITPEESAFAYERELRSFYGAQEFDPARPLFAITLLGVGEDGHLASLFPGQTVLKERQHWTAAVIGAAPEPRITLTYPALESSRHAAFVVAGAAKAGILRRLREGDPALPTSNFQPIGELCMFADAAPAAPKAP